MERSWASIKNHLKMRDWKWITKIVCLITIIILITMDQMVKYVVQRDLKLNQEYPFLPGFINFKYIINTGSAFGFFQGKHWFLVSFALIITFCALIWLLFLNSITRAFGLSFIIAGTLGNVVDRFLNDGGVVDFLAWELFPPYTIFNTADIFITIGVIIIVLQLIITPIVDAYHEKKEEKNNDKTKKNQYSHLRKFTTKDYYHQMCAFIALTSGQVFGNSIKYSPLFAQFYPKFNYY